MRIYVASSWRNTRQEDVVKILRNNGYEVYDFKNPPQKSGFTWSQANSDLESFNPFITAEEHKKMLETSEVCSHGFLADYRAMCWADACVLVLPCGRSAHLEAGWFAGKNKRLIILLEDGQPDLMNLLATDLCTTVEEVLDCLK